VPVSIRKRHFESAAVRNTEIMPSPPPLTTIRSSIVTDHTHCAPVPSLAEHRTKENPRTEDYTF
jgi:hypothetical protein